MKKLRKALSTELTQIYLMGYDAWGKSDSITVYLQECRLSTKYQRGTWWVLEEKGQLLSSLIIYDLSDHVLGIGSVSTYPARRHKGYATTMLIKFMTRYSDCSFFLFSDIDPSFYSRLGFQAVSKENQPYSDTTLMYYPKDFRPERDQLPTYF
ncbi:GNAT family N-acetyltransferase [Oenococcus alcoholitolerans]|uniref:GNAT family N-acetyltransferase n=1 Tax=Oenococcus alcoholitolerans TaxID=931074 RepID=UPI003F72B656